ncbi:MAG: hypothetical protein ACREGG_01905 [Candidatus Saccharimonadales bacterium]
MTKRGHEAPHLDNAKGPNLFNPLAQEIPVPGTSSEPAQISEGEEQPPKPITEIMAEHEQRTAERAARWQELTDSNWLPGRIEEQLDKEFPDLKTSDQIERESRAQDAAIRRQRRIENGPSSRPAPTRSGLGSTQRLNADEPPANVPDSRKTY